MDFVSEPANEKDETITSGDFWPAINTHAFRESMRVDGTVTQSRLIEALKTPSSKPTVNYPAFNSKKSTWAMQR